MNPTMQAAQELKAHLETSMGLLRTLRDEIRVELHLGGMEAKDQWKRLELRFAEVERAAKAAGADSRQVVDEVMEALKSFRSSLQKQKIPPS